MDVRLHRRSDGYHCDLGRSTLVASGGTYDVHYCSLSQDPHTVGSDLHFDEAMAMARKAVEDGIREVAGPGRTVIIRG